MMRALAALALLAVTSCATTPPVTGLAPYCSSEGAFGERFGPDPAFDGDPSRWVSPPAPGFGPFAEVELGHTLRSGIIHTISARGGFYESGDIATAMVEAERGYIALRAEIEASGAFTIRRANEYQARYTSTGRPEDEVRLLLSRSGSQLSIVCTKVSYGRQVYDELPEDMQRMIDDWSVRQNERNETPAE